MSLIPSRQLPPRQNNLEILRGLNPKKQNQKGATLIELMVGITIGLVTIAAAMGALVLSRNVAGTTTDASGLQQQAAHVFRLLGQQARQAGSVQLNLGSQVVQDATGKFSTTPTEFDVVAFDASFAKQSQAVTGVGSPGTDEYKLTLGYQNYNEYTVASGDEVASLFRDCLGQGADSTGKLSAATIISQFKVANNSAGIPELVCAGVNNAAQPLARNVADFRVNYLLQNTGASGTPRIQRASATDAAADWSRVFAIEVCLELYGDERIELPEGSSYPSCQEGEDGSPSRIDMTSSSLSDQRRNRLHMAFRNTYQLRSQGLSN